MPEYSEQDLKYAAELRDEVHKEALAIVRKTRPDITEVIDRHPVEDYFQESWEYPGRWYTVVAVPYGYKNRGELVDTIVRDTLSGGVPEKEQSDTQELRENAKAEAGRKELPGQLDAKPEGYRELFVVEAGQDKHSFRAVGTDDEGRYIMEQFEEYTTDGGEVSSEGSYFVLSDPEYARFARLALLGGQLNEEEYHRFTALPENPKPGSDSFYSLIAEYPDLALDYFIIDNEQNYSGYESHRWALKNAFRMLCWEWNGNPDRALGKKVAPSELFSSKYQKGKLNYRRAFLYPPHNNGYTGKDFVRVNAELFPNGTDGLEVYEWTTDWSDYFDDGHEWWGTLCLTVYDRTLDRFVLIMASATD